MTYLLRPGRFDAGYGNTIYDAFNGTAADSFNGRVSDSGHTWVDANGYHEIAANGTGAQARNTSSNPPPRKSIIDCGSGDGVLTIHCEYGDPGVSGNIYMGAVLRLSDASNYIRLVIRQQPGAPMRAGFAAVVGGSGSGLASEQDVGPELNDGDPFDIIVTLDGDSLTADIYEASFSVTSTYNQTETFMGIESWWNGNYYRGQYLDFEFVPA